MYIRDCPANPATNQSFFLGSGKALLVPNNDSWNLDGLS